MCESLGPGSERDGAGSDTTGQAPHVANTLEQWEHQEQAFGNETWNESGNETWNEFGNETRNESENGT